MKKLLLSFLVVSFLLVATNGYCVDKRILLWDNVAKKQTALADGSANQVPFTDGSGTVAWGSFYKVGGTDVPVADGGTGASDASTARGNLGLGTIATQASNNVSITGGSVTGITDLAVADGGTAKSSWTQYLITYADTTTSFSQIAIGTAGQVLKSNGAGSVASFQTLDQSVNHKWNIAVTQPNAMYSAGSTIIPIGTAPANLTVTNIKCNTSSASYEVAGDLKYADARIGLANATVVMILTQRVEREMTAQLQAVQ